MWGSAISDSDEHITSSPRIQYRENAYVKTFDDTVSFALERNANLWTADEKQLLLQCRPHVLPEGARVVLSRLSLRRMKWIKSTSISHYVVQAQQSDAPIGGLIESLELLKSNHFIECLQPSTTFETAFEAVESCFLLDDLTRLCKRITTSKSSSANNKVMNKEGILEAIFNAVRTQRTLFGQSLTHKFAGSVLEVLKELQPAVPWKQRNSFPLNSYTSRPALSNGTNHSKDAGANKLVILRIQPQVLHLLRRCQRIYQISCNAGGNGYSGNTSSSPTNNFMTNPGAAAANNTSAASTGFASVLQPLEFNAPLLVIFNKVQYPPYVEHCARNAVKMGAGQGVVSQNSRIFESQLAFKRWEGAVELHAACLDKSIEEVLLNEHSTSRLRALLGTFHSPTFLHRYLNPLAAAPGSTGTGTAEQTKATTSSSNSESDTRMGAGEEVVVAAAKTAAGQSKRKTVVNTKVDLSALSRAHLLAVLSLLSYHHSQQQASNDVGAGRQSDSCEVQRQQDTPFADYMIKFDAGSQLAYACSDGAAQLEKEPFRQYSFAILLQELLLSLPYLPHRRGLWYKRLCINYAHLQLHRCALRACLRCLADPLVNVSDKTELQTRAASLNAKILKQSVAKCPGKRQSVAANADAAADAVKVEAGLASPPLHREYAVFALEKDFPAVQVLVQIAPWEGNTSVRPVVNVKADETVNCLAESTTGNRPAPHTSRGKRSIKTDTVLSTEELSAAEDRQPLSLLENNDILTAMWLINTLPSGDDAPVTAVEVLCTSILQHILRTADVTKWATVAPAAVKEPVLTPRQTPFVPYKPQWDTISTSSVTKSITLGGGNGHATAVAALASSSKKRKLSLPTPAGPSSKVSKTTAMVETTAVAWACTFCTFINSSGRAVVCEVCLQKRSITSSATSSSSNSVRSASTASFMKSSTIATALPKSSSTALFRSTTGSTKATPQVKELAAAPVARAVSYNDVVDLVSDSDLDNDGNSNIDGGEDVDEPIFIASTSSGAVTSSVKTVTSLNTSVSAATSTFIDARKDASVTLLDVSTNKTEDGAVEVSQRFLAAAKEHLESSWVSMQRHLVTLTSQRSFAHARDVSATTISECTGTGNMSRAMADALNLQSRSEADEEQDDLVLLGLLPPSVIKCENTTSSGRVSLENLIPAPPFFVVNGKRTGDPANRKGKSKFCGVNDELVNVETFVMQKCFAVDPDDCLEEEGALIEVAAEDNTIRDAEEGDWEDAVVKQEDPRDPGAGCEDGENTEEDTTQAEEMDVMETERCADSSVRIGDVRRSPRARAQRFSNDNNYTEIEELQADAEETPSKNRNGAKDPAVKSPRARKEKGSAADRSNSTQPRAPPVVVKSKRGVGVAYSVAVEGGGWQGWHCEGAVFQSLFGLLMWDVLFTCPCRPTAGGTACAAGSDGATATECSVFITPFQDAPLDLGHRSFFRSRRARIMARIAQITAFSTQELIAELGSVYRNHYGESCRGVHWGITLRLLQLMAVCMGSAAVAAVCRALAVNYKHFTGGAPDLMLVRVQRRVLCTTTRLCTGACCGAAGGSDGDLSNPHCTSNTAEAVHDVRQVEGFQLVDVSSLLGVDWASQMQSEVVLSRRRTTASAAEDLLGASSLGQKSPGNRPGLLDETQEMDVEWMAEENGDDVEDLRDEGADEAFPVEGDTPGLRSSEQDPADTTALGVHVAPKNEHIRDLFLPSLAPTTTATADAASEPDAALLCNKCRHPCAVERQYTYDYKLQAKYVEVKGPTDSLMFRQRVWLHMLNQANRVASGDMGTGLFDAYVCNVKE